MQIDAAIIGGGPAGLMAAEALLTAGHSVHLFDAMPSLGRKFLMAGKSGLNLTHAEPFDQFLDRFGKAKGVLEPSLREFTPDAVRQWANELGTETFVGSSGHVFPKSMKAAPLLRAWLRRLRAAGLIIHVRHKWMGWTQEGASTFKTPDGPVEVNAKATILALGGGSWPQLGSDGTWVPILADRGLCVQPLRSANCGFDVDWSPHFRERFAGSPVKSVSLTVASQETSGEFVVTDGGVEGGGIYTHASALLDELTATGRAVVYLDLMPDVPLAKVQARLERPQGSRSFSTHLKRVTGLKGVKAGLLRECAGVQLGDPLSTARAIKSLPLTLSSARPLKEAISSAGGVGFENLDASYQVNDVPGLFCAGEMLDWDAPTGGYLLTACMATGRTAGVAAAQFLAQSSSG